MVSLLFPFALLPYALAAPNPIPHATPIHFPIVRRSTTVQDLPRILDSIRLKYGYSTHNQKRSTTSTALTDEANDSSYSAVVSIGTPAQNFNLILDTGSSDLWVATDQCSDCPSGTPLFNPTQSSTYKNESSSLQITYGSGSVAGYVSQDTVSFAGFTISGQSLLSVADTSSGLLSDGLSGIMGLGFEPLSSLNVTPFWQSLYEQNKLSSPTLGFYLERDNSQTQVNTAPGGTFTLGGTNTSLYTGNINFIDMPAGSTPSYWLQLVQTVTMQGNSISIASSDGLAAIDTGTTLIGAPSTIVKEIWQNVPGSFALSGQFQGMYAFPCDTTLDVTISFGGTHWAISDADMNLGEVTTSGSTAMCAGGIFDIGSTTGNSQNAPAWIVGDTFLKNVYSVFQANPPAVGFAQLASGLNNNTSSGTSPSSTSGTSSSSGASLGMSVSMSLSLVMSLLAGLFVTL